MAEVNGKAIKGEGIKVQLSRKAILERIRPHVPKAIQTLVELLDSPNESMRMGAAKTLLAKVVPDLKAAELTGEEGSAIKIIVTGYGVKKESPGESCYPLK